MNSPTLFSFSVTDEIRTISLWNESRGDEAMMFSSSKAEPEVSWSGLARTICWSKAHTDLARAARPMR